MRNCLNIDATSNTIARRLPVVERTSCVYRDEQALYSFRLQFQFPIKEESKRLI